MCYRTLAALCSLFKSSAVQPAHAKRFKDTRNTPGIDCAGLMQPCLAWLLSCSAAAHAIAVRPRDVKIRGIAAPVRIYEAESQDAALEDCERTQTHCKETRNTPGIDCTGLMQPCLAWLLLCSTAAHAIAVRPRDVQIAGIAAPVRIYEAESQDAALDAAIETDSDPFGACCWPSAVVAARSLAARDVAGLRVLELGAGTGLASATAARLGADVVATDVSDISLELLRRAADGAFDVQRLDFTDATAVAALGHFDVVVATVAACPPFAKPPILLRSCG